MGIDGRLAVAFAGLVTVTALTIGTASYVTTDRQVTNEIDDFLEVRAHEIAGGERDGPEGRADERADAKDGHRGDQDDDNRDNDGDRGNDDHDGDRDRDQSSRADEDPTGTDGIDAPDGTETETQDDEPETVVVAVEPDSEVQILDEAGNISANSGLVLPVDETDARLAAQDEPARLRTVTIDDDEFRMITKHIPGGGAVQVARSLGEANALLELIRSQLFIITGLMAVIAAGLGWMLARRTTRPLRSLTEAVDAVAQTGDFSIPVTAPGTGTDEVGRLAQGFGDMLEALEVSREQQRRLVQDAAHELRTPLTSITANIDFLSHAAGVDRATRTETLGDVRRELTELNLVISEIIDLATDRYDLRPFEPVDLMVVADDALRRFGTRSNRSVHLDVESTMVTGDPEALGRAVDNLLTNADKYSPLDTAVTVEVRDRGLWVNDCGDGIPEAERDLIFDRFYRREEHRSKPGSGLGLSIVARIVEAHDGTVEVGEATSGGTRIGFHLRVDERESS